MQFSFNDKRARRGIMQAKDLFTEDLKQIFSLKTGDYLGWLPIHSDEELDEPEEEQKPEETKPKDPNQLKLF